MLFVKIPNLIPKCMMQRFIEAIQSSYSFKSPTLFLGAGVLEGEIIEESQVKLPLGMMNRHGLITGATGSGKTRTLQLIAEQLSLSGVPVFMPDMKGDLSGMALEGSANARILERAKALGIAFSPMAFPIELFSLSGKSGAQMRATLTEFGPILLGKILELSETQTGVLNILFKYADDKNLPIVDLNDLKKVLIFLSEGPGAQEIKNEYGKISSSTTGTLLRKIVSLEQQGIGQLFGEPSFDIEDLMQKVDGRGVITLLNVSDMQDKPMVFSTFMLALLAELYQNLPEVGDLDKPKLVFFLDEAHLLFKDASKAFLDQIEQVIRLIRSKGVGIFFCTQQTQDVPPSVLSQLGNRIQHVIRAFTPNDVKALKDTVKTFPKTDFYNLESQFTQLGIGQALVTVLNEKGIPTETVVTHLSPPRSSMGPLSAEDYKKRLLVSAFFEKYKEPFDPESAFEILEERMTRFEEQEKRYRQPSSRQKGRPRSTLEQAMTSTLARSVGRELVRGLFGMLFGVPKARRRTR